MFVAIYTRRRLLNIDECADTLHSKQTQYGSLEL